MCWRATFAWIVLPGLFAVAIPQRAGAQIKSNLSSSVTSESMTHVWVARDRGLFKKYGVDMQFILMPRNPLAIAALLAGEIDAAIIGPGHLVNAGLSGAELAGIGYLVVLRFRRVRLRVDVLKLFSFEVDAERDEVPPCTPGPRSGWRRHFGVLPCLFHDLCDERGDVGLRRRPGRRRHEWFPVRWVREMTSRAVSRS